MKKLTLVKILSALFCATILISSCKKKNPEPAPVANADNVDMGTSSEVTINVLGNDSYKEGVAVVVTNYLGYGTVKVNSNNTVTFTPRTNFYGTANLQYILNDNNGSSAATLTIKCGTNEQINTSRILNKFYTNDDNNITNLFLFSIDGDSSRIYGPNYINEGVSYVFFGSNKLFLTSRTNLVPETGNYNYTIVGDGNVLTYADIDNTPVLLVNIQEFSASAKKQDGSGYMNVSGFSFEYNGKILVYTTRVL